MKKTTSFFTSACVIFTLFTILLHLADFALGGGASKLVAQLLLLLACLLLAAANRILYAKKLPLAARLALHYAAVCAVLLGVFGLVGNLVSKPVQILILYACVTLVYIGFAVGYLVVTGRKKAKKSDAEEYKSIF